MAKKKETEQTLTSTEAPDADLLNTANAAAPADIVIGEVDFNDLFQLEKDARSTEEQLNKISGAIFRLSKDQEVYFNHEKKLSLEIDAKRRDLIKRYRLDEQRQWKIDVNTRKIVYS